MLSKSSRNCNQPVISSLNGSSGAEYIYLGRSTSTIEMSTAPNYYTHHRREMIPALPQNYTRVLEIGCGEGRFRVNLEQSHEYWGLEPAPAAAKIAQSALDRVLVGTYMESIEELPEKYFDLIICNDVIEHMTDHDFFFHSIQSKLSADGALVASIPNVRHILNLYELLIKKDWEYKEAGILDKTHFRFFTEKSLRRSLAKHHFQVEYFQGINRYEGDSVLKGLFGQLVTLVLGKDTRYLQFAIRVRRADN